MSESEQTRLDRMETHDENVELERRIRQSRDLDLGRIPLPANLAVVFA